MRQSRRLLRDSTNPFEMPNINFKQMFRLDKDSVINLINDIEPFINRQRVVTIPLHIKVFPCGNYLKHFIYFQNCRYWQHYISLPMDHTKTQLGAIPIYP